MAKGMALPRTGPVGPCILRSIALLLTMSLDAAACSVAAQQALPVLRYDPPPGWYRGASVMPEVYSSNEVNAGVQVYPFRPITGDFERLLRQDHLRSWLDPQFQESNVATPVTVDEMPFQGGDRAYVVRFNESVVGVLRRHVRLVLVARGAAAIVDASGSPLESYERAAPVLIPMFQSVRVDSEAIAASPPPPGAPPSAAGKAIAGLYMGSRMRFMPDLQRGAAYGRTVSALYFYLLSADGHFYRFYEVPEGDLTHFDFARAGREDPENSGRYAVDGGKLTLFVGGSQPQRIATAAPKAGRLEIEGVVYLHQ